MHELDGEYDGMFSVRKVPWHKSLTGDKSTVTDDYPQTFQEARVLSHLDWDPAEQAAMFEIMARPEFFKQAAAIMLDTSLTTVQQLNGLWALHQSAYREDPDFRRIFHPGTNYSLAYKGEGFSVIPNSTFGELMEALMEVDKDLIKLETGGCLAGGRKVWMLASLDNPIVIKGDRTYTLPFMALTQKHDGTGSLTARATAVRIVCGNTFDASEAEGKRTGAYYNIVHRANWPSKIEVAKNAVRFGRKQMAEYAELMERYVKMPVTAEQESQFIDRFLPFPEQGTKSDTERKRNNVRMSRKQLVTILNSPTVEGAGVRGTAYGLLQGAGEYADYGIERRNQDTLIDRNVLSMSSVKVGAAKILQEVCA
jgi:phage/plasmid-like protein (TIGR03299 family)